MLLLQADDDEEDAVTTTTTAAAAAADAAWKLHLNKNGKHFTHKAFSALKTGTSTALK